MTKQKKIYFLLFIVLMVWGLVAFQLFGYLSPGLEVNSSIEKKEKLYYIQKEKEIYNVSKHKRDPFLGKTKTNKKKYKEKVNTNTFASFPDIYFNGIVKGGGSQSYIITINGRQRILKVGQLVDSVKLVSGNNYHVVLNHKGIIKTLEIQ